MPAESLDLREFGERVEFIIQALEAPGGFGVFAEPGAVFPADGLEFVAAVLDLGDGVVEVVHSGLDGDDVVRFSGGLFVGPSGGLLAPMAAVPPVVGRLGMALCVGVLVPGLDVPPGGLTFGRSRVPSSAGQEVRAVPAERGQVLLHLGQLGAGVVGDGGGDGVPFGLEAGVAEGGADPGGGLVVVFDGEGVGGGGAGVDGPAGAAVDGPVRVRSSAAWSRSSATTWTVLHCRPRLMET